MNYITTALNAVLVDILGDQAQRNLGMLLIFYLPLMF